MLNSLTATFGAIASLAAIIAAVYSAYRWSFKRGFERAKSQILAEHFKEQYAKVYAPLRALFLPIQVTTASSMHYPYLTQRFERAFALLCKGKTDKAFKAIFDKRVTKPSAEIEFGPEFPLSAIKKILTENAALADPELMNLYQRCDRAQYESQLGGGKSYSQALLGEEYELFEHVAEKYVEMSKRFGKST